MCSTVSVRRIFPRLRHRIDAPHDRLKAANLHNYHLYRFRQVLSARGRVRELYFDKRSIAPPTIPTMSTRVISMPGPSYVEERLTDGVRFVLPRRELGKVCRWGWAICGVAGFGMLFMLGWMAVPFTAGVAIIGKLPIMGLAAFGFSALGLAGLLPMLKLFALGWAVVRDATFTEVVLRDRWLTCYERFWMLKYTRRCRTPVEDLQTFSLQPAQLSSAEADSGPPIITLGGCAEMLVVRWGNGKQQQFTIAAPYPREILQKLMVDLRTHLRHVTIAIPQDAGARSRTLADEPTERSERAAQDFPDEITQPPGSDVTVERRDDGITLTVPPAGVVRGSKGLFVFALFWNGLIGLCVVLLTLAASGILDAPRLTPWVGLLFLLPFMAVGAGTLLGAINMGIRTTAIATSGGQLFVARTGLLGKKTQQWCLGELLRIQIGSSGMAVNDQPIQELQIHGTRGKFGMLSERPEMELYWIATELNQSLRRSPLQTPG